MEDKRFDKIIEKLVEQYEINYSPDSWKRLEKKLNHEDQEDNVFDKLIAHKLANYTIPFSSGAFAKFESRTGRKSTGTNNTLKHIAGIAASLLLFLGSIAYFIKSDSNKSDTLLNTNKTSDKPVTINPAQTAVSESKTIFAQKSRKQQNKSSLQIRKFKSENNNHYLLKDQNYSDSGISYSFNNNIFVSPTQEYYNGIANNTKIIRNIEISNTESALLALTGVNSIVMPKKASIEYEKPIVSNITIDNPNNYPISRQKNKILSETKYNNLSIEEPKNQDNKTNSTEHQDASYSESSISKEKRKFYNIKIHGNPIISFINTPNDLLLNMPGYNSTAIGYNIGTGFSKRIQKSEFGAGIEFYGLSYSPKKITVSIDNKSFWMDKIGYQKFGVPVFYKFYFPLGKKLELSICTAIETQIISNSNFRFIESINEGGTLEKLAKELLESNDFKQTIYASKDYNKGVLEGGNTSSNISIAANFGFGIEKKLSTTLSLFIEPEISTMILSRRFGPNKDKFTNLNLKIGINKSFNL